jgi:hypothetical protein
MPADPICAALHAKIGEQIERTAHLIALLPDGRRDWLLGHLLDCLAGFCAVLYTAAPDRLAHFAELRRLPVNHDCDKAEALARLPVYARHIDEGFAALRDADLARAVSTVFVPQGESIATLLLGNLEHLINHKHQLFTILKEIGAPVGTPDLYRFRGE